MIEMVVLLAIASLSLFVFTFLREVEMETMRDSFSVLVFAVVAGIILLLGVASVGLLILLGPGL
ncbi:hypothetical protein [Corynebacterium lactis]|uniref:Uncharacterized protein n=1 Tax=Corynebacterium lactis RW2-5 TaxID=1408189 RepID=A0A0K2H3U2_9CORY|nr:hypothetical protein [Corynebacterium lactis]ALA68618.1 hypothetical protein CLAC_09200 [Corynebacterium lactis RW2-5]